MDAQVSGPLFLPTIQPIKIGGVFNRGVANKELIRLDIERAVDLRPYFVTLGLRATPGIAAPIRDKVLWLSGFAAPATNIFIFTGKGEPSEFKTLANTDARLIYWNLATTVFANPNIVAMLGCVGSVTVSESPLDTVRDQPQSS